MSDIYITWTLSGRKCRPHAVRTIYSELLGCKQIRNPMSCDGDEDDNKKNNNNYRLYYTVFFGTVHGYSILLAAVKLDDPWRLDFSRVYTLIDMSVNNPLYYIMYIGTQYTLCGLRRRIVWKCIKKKDQTATIGIRNIWALKVLLCTYPTCIYINVQNGCIRRIII